MVQLSKCCGSCCEHSPLQSSLPLTILKLLGTGLHEQKDHDIIPADQYGATVQGSLALGYYNLYLKILGRSIIIYD